MHELDDGQWDALRKLHRLASLADMEADAALYSDSMDDAKAVILAVVTAAGALNLPNGLAGDLQRLAQEASKAADSSGDLKSRVMAAMMATDQIEQLIESHFAAGGRRL